MAPGKRECGMRPCASRVAVPNGIARVSFPGGSMVLSARNPYDRQLLVEYLVDRARAKDRVQVLVGDLRWTVHPRQGKRVAQCSACGGDLRASCYSTDERGQGFCLGCAFRDSTAEVEPSLEWERSAS